MDKSVDFSLPNTAKGRRKDVSAKTALGTGNNGNCQCLLHAQLQELQLGKATSALTTACFSQKLFPISSQFWTRMTCFKRSKREGRMALFHSL